MAEFLIKKVDATHEDSAKDKQGCYKRGDVVQVYEDGECREPPSPNSKMLIVKVPGVTKRDAEKYVKSHIEPRPRIESWNIFDWAIAEKEKQYWDFIVKPSVLSETEQQQEYVVSIERWKKMQAEKDYYPFWEKPVAEETKDKINLSGIIKIVKLQGDANTIITRRKYYFDFDILTSKITNDLETERETTITVLQAENFLKLKI